MASRDWSMHVHSVLSRAGLKRGGARERVIELLAEQPCAHLVCERCGRLVAFDDPGLEHAIDRLSRRLGVTVESHDVLLRGDCRQCE